MMARIAHIHPAPHMCSASFRSSAAPNQRPADVGGPSCGAAAGATGSDSSGDGTARHDDVALKALARRRRVVGLGG